MRVLISGGGTGGHVYPAIALANAIKDKDPSAEILFVGAQGKLEMKKVPAAGYFIIGLWISGFQRKLSIRNLLFPFKLASSLYRGRKIIMDYKPDVVVGVGGYADSKAWEVTTNSTSGSNVGDIDQVFPTLQDFSKANIPTNV